MLITRKSPLTGAEQTRELDVTQEEIVAWAGGTLIQRAMPRLSAAEREFVKTGYTEEDWAKMFPPEEE